MYTSTVHAMQSYLSHEYLIYYILTYYATLEFKGAGISLEATIMSTAIVQQFKLSTVHV